MKKHIIAILYVAWALCLIGLFAIVSFYIDRKRDRLHAEIKDNITKLFEGQSSGDAFVSNNDGLFFDGYSGHQYAIINGFQYRNVLSKIALLPI